MLHIPEQGGKTFYVGIYELVNWNTRTVYWWFGVFNLIFQSTIARKKNLIHGTFERLLSY